MEYLHQEVLEPAISQTVLLYGKSESLSDLSQKSCGGDYTVTELGLEELIKLLKVKHKMHDQVAMIAEKMGEPQFKGLNLVRFEKYLRKTLWA
jgi:hypothetical protein